MKLKYEPLQCIECGGFLRDFLPGCRCEKPTTIGATFCDCGQCESSRRGMKETGRKYQVPPSTGPGDPNG